MKRLLTLIVFFIFIGNFIYANKFTVVLDPGHGGRDAGAVRGTIKEKDINLAVALKLGKLIEDNHPDVKVVYTRKQDSFVDLKKRADIANKQKANLFISIHTNSTAAKNTTVSGADTYIMGLARSQENLEVAKRENSVILLEDDYKQKYENFDPNSPESYIIFEFMTNKYVEQSLDFASSVQSNIKSVAKRADRGVKQAGFLVLRETAMPSVLIELGFINNATEAKYLASANGQSSMANAIYRGFANYKKEFDKKQGKVVAVAPATHVENSTSAKNVKEQNERSGEIEYRVQILTEDKKLPANSSKLKGLSPTDFYIDKGKYKYTYGSTTNHNEALRLQKEARKFFKDAFVIKFRNGERIQ